MTSRPSMPEMALMPSPGDSMGEAERAWVCAGLPTLYCDHEEPELILVPGEVPLICLPRGYADDALLREMGYRYCFLGFGLRRKGWLHLLRRLMLYLEGEEINRKAGEAPREEAG